MPTKALAALAGLALVAGAVVWAVVPAAADRPGAPCAALPGEGWRAEVVPPMPRDAGRAGQATNRAFVSSGLWQLVVGTARAQHESLHDVAVRLFGPQATVLDLQRVAWRAWTEVDASRWAGSSDAQGTTELPATARDRVVCVRPLAPAERDPDGPGGRPPVAAYVVRLADNPHPGRTGV
jgi:hypothetical protein